MSTLENVKADLARLRDEAKVQAHLGSMEARQQWDEAETRWNHFVAQAGVADSAANVKGALEELAGELRTAYERLKRAV